MSIKSFFNDLYEFAFTKDKVVMEQMSEEEYIEIFIRRYRKYL